MKSENLIKFIFVKTEQRKTVIKLALISFFPGITVFKPAPKKPSSSRLAQGSFGWRRLNQVNFFFLDASSTIADYEVPHVPFHTKYPSQTAVAVSL